MIHVLPRADFTNRDSGEGKPMLLSYRFQSVTLFGSSISKFRNFGIPELRKLAVRCQNIDFNFRTRNTFSVSEFMRIRERKKLIFLSVPVSVLVYKVSINYI